ncbi:MAG: Coenzyme F420 hydrogenase/dehydrogenase, beta subunit C-terminal domain [Promethearchaeota archaeon]
MKIEKGSADLEAEVIFREICAHCGMCGWCPHIEYEEDGTPRLLDTCNEVVGYCYNACPRTNFNVSLLEEKMFGKTREDEFLGVYDEKVSVKSKNSKGILNALVETAFKHDLIDAMVVPENKSKKPVNNVGVVVTEPGKLPELTNRNTSYTGPLVMGINKAYLNGRKAVGIIGNPCHHQGVTNLYYSDFRTGINVTKLKIAVMCSAGGAKGCIYCVDYAGEFADISYGTAGMEKGTAVLLIRTETGKKLYDLAIKDKAIEKVSENPNMEKILSSAARKKKKNVKNLLKKSIGKIGYLELNDKELAAYFG